MGEIGPQDPQGGGFDFPELARAGLARRRAPSQRERVRMSTSPKARLDFCVICGNQGRATGPPPCVHLTCVLAAQPSPIPERILHYHSIANRTGRPVFDTKHTRQRLHPAVFWKQ